MKKIPLTQGKFALVDDEDFEYLSKFKWHAWYNKNTNSYYACRKYKIGVNKQGCKYMHREIMKPLNDKNVDHIDHDTLNNVKSNLRRVTIAQNLMNRGPHKSSTSKYKGVYWDNRYKKWRATIRYKNKRKSLGYFHCEKEAAKSYNIEALNLFGEYAFINLL